MDFRKQLRSALADLQTVGALARWRIDEATDTVHVTLESRRDLGGTSTPVSVASASLPATPEVPRQATLPLPVTASVGADARATFRGLYPDKDVERCLADFLAWLGNKGHTARNPDAAFLGFARKWAAPS